MKRKRIMESLTINELSAVDKAAQAPALAVLLKRAPKAKPKRKETPAGEPEDEDEEEMPHYGKSMGFSRPVLTTAEDGHSHILDDCGQGGTTSWSKSEGEENGHDHPWVRQMDGSILIGAAEGHTHGIMNTTKSAGGTSGGQDGEQDMTKQQNEPAAGIPEAVQKSIADLTTRAERAEAIVKMSAPERAHFDALKAEAQDAFLKMTAEQRGAEVRNAADANRVVYKSEAGQEFRLSDDPRLVEMAKSADADRRARREADERLAKVAFEKRAGEEIPNLPGTVEVRAGILKALEGVPGAAELLKAANDALAPAFQKSGTKAGGSGEFTKAEDQLEALAKQYAVTNKVAIEKARAAVLHTPEGEALYAQMSA